MKRRARRSNPLPERITLDALRERVLRPDWRGDQSLRTAAWRAKSAREAWESFYSMGRLPEAWLDDPLRRFAKGTAKITRQPHKAQLFAQPTNPATALAVASDLGGVRTAEEMAREAARLLPLGHEYGRAFVPDAPIVWRPTHWYEVGLPKVVYFALTAMGVALRYGYERGYAAEDRLSELARIASRSTSTDLRARAVTIASGLLEAAKTWDRAARDGIEFFQMFRWPQSQNKPAKPFDVALNPFRPLVALIATGYWIDEVFPDVIWLRIPTGQE